MSSTTKLSSVTKPHTAAACMAMIEKIRTYDDTSLFENTRERRKETSVNCADGTTATLANVIASTTGAYLGIGYTFCVEKPGMTIENLNIWIGSPSQDAEVNRRYLMRVLQNIVSNPHAGKSSFNGGPDYV